MITDDEWWEIFHLLPYESKPIREALDELVAARVRTARAQTLEDAANWYETPVTADNYPGFAEVLRANAAQLRRRQPESDTNQTS